MMEFSLSPRLALISLVAVIARVASAKSDTSGTWLYPDPSTAPTFNYLDTLNASWESDFSSPWLHLWCGAINNSYTSPVSGEPYNNTARATGSRLFPLSQMFSINQAPEPFSCHFELSRNAAVGEGPPYALGNTFFVQIDSNAKPVTWSQGTANSSAASSSNGTDTGPSPESTTASPVSSNSTAGVQASSSSSSSNSNSGLSPGAKAGIGVGVALGVLALIAGAAALFWHRRRRTAKATTAETSHGAYGTRPLPLEKNGSSKMVRAEMPADSQVHEKDSAPVATHTIGELEATPRY